jgi:hypothetical protein
MAEIKLYRGDSYPLVFVFKDKSTGSPIPITGWSFKMTVSTEKDPADETTKKFSIDAVIVDAPNGKFSFLPTEANNADIGKFFYDIQYTNPSGHKRTIAKDKYTISQDIGK